MKLSITAAWNETAAFLQKEWWPVFLIAFALTSLPGLILQALMPGMMAGRMAMTPGSPPDLAQLVAAMRPFFLALIPLLLLSMWGNLTVNVLALRRETVVGSAFGRAARRLPALIGATLLLFVVLLIASLPIGVALAMGIRSGHAGLPALLIVLLVVAAVFVMVRLIPMNAAAAAEDVGPIGILRRSWQLTAGHFWKLLAFLLLMVVLFLVIMMAVGAVFGILIVLVTGPPLPGSFAAFVVSLVSGLVQAGFISVFLVFVARIYAQLAGDPASVAKVFD
jgi:hypothetical protein